MTTMSGSSPQPSLESQRGMLAGAFVAQGDTVVAPGILPAAAGAQLMFVNQQITIPATGHQVRFTWDAVPGATGAMVTAAGLRISAVATQRTMGELILKQAGSHYEVTTNDKRVCALNLTNLKFTRPAQQQPTTVTSQS